MMEHSIPKINEEDDNEELASGTSSLDAFRQNWKAEINQKNVQNPVPLVKTERSAEDIEQEARSCFLKGVELEQAGKLCDAIVCYRRAIHLVPNIESKVSEELRLQDNQSSQSQEAAGEEEDTDFSDISDLEEDDDDDLTDLTSRFVRMRVDDRCVCRPRFPQSTSTHVSELPAELIELIVRWVVSADLDLRSLDSLAAVSRGFYLIARDPYLWKQIAVRMWGVGCGSVTGYGGWRQMVLERPQLRYNGCYISKSTYIRAGEPTMQFSYRPFHFVQYFRYIRFFPEGRVLMMTSADEPPVAVQKLRTRGCAWPGLLHGYYRLTANTVTLVLRRLNSVSQPRSRYKRRAVAAEPTDTTDTTFHCELILSNAAKRRFAKLTWQRYSTVRKLNDVVSESDFSLADKPFPSLIFSRVKSYTSESDRPL